MLRNKIFVVVSILLVSTITGQQKYSLNNLNKTNSYHDLLTAINQMKLGISNLSNGLSYRDEGALKWPGGINAYQAVLFMDHLLFSGYIDTILNATRIFHAWYKPGKILDNGLPDDEELEKYRIYRIKKGWETMLPSADRDLLEKDYNEWPVEDGAPWIDLDNDGVFTHGIDKPEIIGDETLWYVCNDLHDSTEAEFVYFDKHPFGLEFQNTVYAFDRTDDLGDVIFRKTKIINKGGKELKDFHLGYYTDLEVGYSANDKGGCDTVLNLVYAFNGEDNDPHLGNNLPPACGLLLLRGPVVQGESTDSALLNKRWIKGFKNNKMIGSYISAGTGPVWEVGYKYIDPLTAEEVLNVLQGGKIYNGDPIFDPNTGMLTNYSVPGDPVNKTGWYHDPEAWSGLDTVLGEKTDIRMTMLLGNFNLSPYDTQEVVTAFIGGSGPDRLSSITDLKRKCRVVKYFYDNNYLAVPMVTVPELKSYPQESKITLWWDSKAENYSEENKLLSELNYTDKHYRFQGYLIKQYKDQNGSEPVVVDVFDNVDTISVLEDFVVVNGKKVKVPVISGKNKGIRHFIYIDKDAYTGSELYNGNPYYFSVQAYAVNPYSIPSYVISEPKIIEVIPGRSKIDFSSPYENNKYEYAEKVQGEGEGEVYFEVLDPAAIDGSSYEVNFEYMDKKRDTLCYNVIKLSTGETLVKESMNYYPDSLRGLIIDGSFVRVKNTGQMKIDSIGMGKYAINRIIETHGQGGILLDVPGDVFNNFNSTGEWLVTSVGNQLSSINQFDTIKYDDYEIRFKAAGSEYYYFPNTPPNAIFKNNQKAADRVPFEIWNTTQGKRLFIKIKDDINVPGFWSHDSGGTYEKIYAFDPPGEYIEPIPSLSVTSEKRHYPFAQLILKGTLPAEGTIIKIETVKALNSEDKFLVTPKIADQNDLELARTNINEITAFPNPYFGNNELEDSEGKIIRFTGLPMEATIRIYSLAGIFVRSLYKNNIGQYLDWDLRTEEGHYAASGVYIAHLDMPGIGTKIIKLALIMSKEYLNRN